MSRGEHPQKRSLSILVTMAVALGLLAYSQLRPLLNEQFGLPGTRANQELHVELGAELDSDTDPPTDDARDAATTERDKSPAADQLPGELRAEGETLVSKAGLRYGPGGAEGHRLQHVMRHLQDMPERDIHGVFDASGREQLVAVIDEAYRKARSDGDMRKERQRTVYTVDLGRRIGYVGGQVGKRQRYPPCHKVKLVLQQLDVITAYPVER